MEFARKSPMMQQRTTSIVLGSPQSFITSDGSPPPPAPSKKKDKGKKKSKSSKSKSKKVSPHLHRLPKEILSLICEFLTFEEMFVCTRVCRKISRRMLRILTGTKQCSVVEKADLKLLTDPAAFEDGMTFYRSHLPDKLTMNDDESVGRITMAALRTIAKRGKVRGKSGELISNSVQHSVTGQVAFHLKQLEHMVVYTTVNGNEVVRVANNWIFFNGKLFVKITDGLPPSSAVDGDEQRYLVDLILVEASLTRKTKNTFFGRVGTAFVEPFCEISMNGMHLRTSVASQEGDPVWNEDSSFTIGKKSTDNVQIAMFDQGRLGRHNKLGNIEISLKNLACDVLHDMWYPVVQDQDNEISGKFHVLVQKQLIPKNKEADTRTMGILGYCGPICESVPMRLEFGDIIMISNSEFYTHIAKLGTMSMWDHIAMVVEVDKELHLFESSPDGVFTVPLSRRLRFYLKNSTLGIRRLTVGRTHEMKKSLKSFIKEVDGRPYKQNWIDLVRAWQGSNTAEDLSSIFCSELVAAAYQRMGLLGTEISSNNYVPVDFAFNNPKVKLLKGKLENLRMIYSTASV